MTRDNDAVYWAVHDAVNDVVQEAVNLSLDWFSDEAMGFDIYLGVYRTTDRAHGPVLFRIMYGT